MKKLVRVLLITALVLSLFHLIAFAAGVDNDEPLVQKNVATVDNDEPLVQKNVAAVDNDEPLTTTAAV